MAITPVRFVIIGGGPGGHQAATTAARLGAEVTLVERDVIGGAAHLWDCVPSKSMIATGGALSFARRAPGMGLMPLEPEVDVDALKARIAEIEDHLNRSVRDLLDSQGVLTLRGTGKLAGPHEVTVTTDDDGIEELAADAILLCTGSRPRVPDWFEPDGDRLLTTRQAYPPPALPKRLVVIGSGVTGVEFVHMFRSFGSAVSLIVSRQQVLPGRDHEAAAALEYDFLERGVKLLKGARAIGVEREADGVAVHCDDGRVERGSHTLLAIGSLPNSEGLGLEAAGVETDASGYVPIGQHCQTNVRHIYAAGDLSGKVPLSSVASMQGRNIAEHAMGLHTRQHRHLDYDKAAQAVFTEPEIAEVGVAEAEAFAAGRKIRVTKVPFSGNAKAVIDNDRRGFVKILSDPATGVVLGGSIVGRHAAELISVIALAVNAHLKVTDIVETMFVHPSLAESISDAAE
jgi:dihydrolipoamide dehydrogenase